MDSFIYLGDYDSQIQSLSFNEITGGKQNVIDDVQRRAVAEAVSYLNTKYDTSKAFQPITRHDSTLTYKAGQTVYYTAPTYSAITRYRIGDIVTFNGAVYTCSTAITVAEPFTIAHWTLNTTTTSTLYYAINPAPIFDCNTVYFVGDVVFWNNKTYTCQIQSSILDHQSILQIQESNVNPTINIFPDDAKKGVQYWGVGTSYLVPANTALTNTTYWAQGDNRDAKLVEVCVNIALYKLQWRISPQNIPALREKMYMGEPQDRETRGQRVLYPTYSALGWLQACVIGNDVTPSLPLIQPNQGQRINFGGRPRNVNSY